MCQTCFFNICFFSASSSRTQGLGCTLISSHLVHRAPDVGNVNLGCSGRPLKSSVPSGQVLPGCQHWTSVSSKSSATPGLTRPAGRSILLATYGRILAYSSSPVAGTATETAAVVERIISRFRKNGISAVNKLGLLLRVRSYFFIKFGNPITDWGRLANVSPRSS